VGLRQKIPCKEFLVIDVLGKLFCVFFRGIQNLELLHPTESQTQKTYGRGVAVW